MIYLHTSPTDPTAPMWLFHLPTFTLAQLHLNGGPDGHHLLTIDAATPPADEVIAAFATTLDQMAPGASKWLSVITREGIAQDLPEFMAFTSAKGPGHLTVAPGKGYAHRYGMHGTIDYFQKDGNHWGHENTSIRESALAFDESIHVAFW